MKTIIQEKGMKTSSATIMMSILLAVTPLTAEETPQKPQNPKKTKQETTVLYETIGVLSAHAIYLTYVSIGTLADGYAGKTYEKEFTLSMIDEYLNLVTNGIDQMNKLLISGMIVGDDVTYVNSIIETYELLKAEARAFKNYVITGSKEHLQVYSEKRQQAWTTITKLLGIK